MKKVKIRVKKFDELPEAWVGQMRELMGNTYYAEINDDKTALIEIGEDFWYINKNDYTILYNEELKPAKSGPIQSESILTEAEKIVNGERATDYGSAKKSFKRIADLTNLIIDEDETDLMRDEGLLCDTIVCKVLMAVKLSRQSNKHKRDNLVDLCGYAELLNRLEDEI